MPVSDVPFPAFESIPREEMRAAYLWELDREFLDDWQDPRRPWPRLRDSERRELMKWIGRAIFMDDEPPVAASLYPPHMLMAYSPEHGEKLAMGKTEEEWGWFFSELQTCQKQGKVMTDGPESRWGHLNDGYGYFRLALSIDPKRPLKDVMAAIESELKTLHRFPPSKPPPRGEAWPSMLCDLLCLRLERAGNDLEKAIPLLSPFQKTFGLAELDTKKHWSTRRGRAKRAMANRRKELERLRVKECENDRDGPNYWKNEPLSNWGSQGFGGSCSLGFKKPHGLFIGGMEAAFIQKPWTHFLSLHGITTEREDVDWADLWFDFEDWQKANSATYAKLSKEGYDEHQRWLSESVTKRMSAAKDESLSLPSAKVPQEVTQNGVKDAKDPAKEPNSAEG